MNNGKRIQNKICWRYRYSIAVLQINSTVLEIRIWEVGFDYSGGTSDERLKENIRPLKGAAEKVAALRSVEFDWSDEKERERTGNVHDFGFVAQEVEKVIPELVRERNDGMKTVNYGGVVPLLLDVIQDLTKRIEVLEAKAQ